MDQELYIQVVNGQPVDHPIAGWNLRMIYPDATEDNLPKGFERFTRMPPPVLDEYQVLEGVTYEKSNYGWHDRYHIRSMDPVERQQYDDQKEHAQKVMEEIKSYPEVTMKKLAELIADGKVEGTEEAILDYLRKSK